MRKKKLLPIQWPVEEKKNLCSSPSIDSNTTLGKNSKSKHAAPEEVRLLPGTISVTGKEQRLRSLNNKNYTERKSESWKTIGTCAHFYSFKVFWWPVLFHQRRRALSESTSCVFSLNYHWQQIGICNDKAIILRYVERKKRRQKCSFSWSCPGYFIF